MEPNVDYAWKYSEEDYILSMFLLNSDKHLFVCTSNGVLLVVDSHVGKLIKRTNLEGVTMVFTCVQQDQQIYLGTDKGVFQVNSSLLVTSIIQEDGWFEHVCLNEAGTVLLASKNKTLYWFEKQDEHFGLIKLDNSYTSTISSIIFNTGSFLISNYGGNRHFTENDPFNYDFFPWKTSLLTSSWSPNKKFIASSTQENAVHFWYYPFEEGKDFQISGYPSKIKKILWSEDSNLLFLDEDEHVNIWDFSNGPPAGQRPIELYCGRGRVNDFMYKNGMVIIATAYGNVFLYLLENTKNWTEQYIVSGNITTILTNEEMSTIFVGTEQGDIYALELDI
jgi:WD40 repeat protein